MTHKGQCFCGSVQLEAAGERRDGLLPLPLVPLLSGGPVNAFSLWKPEAVKVTAGAEHIADL